MPYKKGKHNIWLQDIEKRKTNFICVIFAQLLGKKQNKRKGELFYKINLLLNVVRESSIETATLVCFIRKLSLLRWVACLVMIP